MQKAVGGAANTSSDAAAKTDQSGWFGTGQAKATTNTKHCGKQWKRVNNCGECRQPLEEWEAGICEGCGLLTGAKNGQKNG